MKKIFDKNNVTPVCAYCEHGKISSDGETVLCRKTGVVDVNFTCRKFRYDPLKRQPRRAKPLDKFSENDFSLSIDENE